MQKLLFLISCVCLFGCVTHKALVSPEKRTQQSVQLAKSLGWKEFTISTHPFTLKAFGSRVSSANKPLTIYIEGDGLAWISEDMPSDNPTPIVPTGLKIAAHEQKNFPVVYLARPCQFVFNGAWEGCKPAYWTNLRFSPVVINAMNQAVDYLKNYYQAKQIILIGYSGGGTLAVLMATKRKDVSKLITIAAPLDTQWWISHQNLTPLNGSLNPSDVWKELISIPQTHWVGGKDTVVPKEIAFAYANHFPLGKKPKIKIINEFDHVCCWATFAKF